MVLAVGASLGRVWVATAVVESYTTVPRSSGANVYVACCVLPRDQCLSAALRVARWVGASSWALRVARVRLA